jgi:hypothetical protein
MAHQLRALALAGALATTSLLVSPASAAQPSTASSSLGLAATAFDHSTYNPAASTADWRCRGWGCGWGHRGWRHRGWRRNRIDAGDVLIGAAVIGGIAAILSSNNRRERDRDVVIVDRDQRDWDRNRDPDWRDDDRRSDDRRGAGRGNGATGLDNAVNLCLDRVERDVRVDTVDNVQRTGAGWLVSGSLFNGTSFLCRIGNNGQIDGVDFDGAVARGGGSSGGAAADASQADGQWSDERYADARVAFANPAQAPAVAPSAAMPAYPGGPIPGEVIPETADSER